MPYRALAADALAAWRDAERRMSQLPADSPDWQKACLEAELAKQRYQEAFDSARAEHLPEPPPFDEASRAIGT